MEIKAYQENDLQAIQILEKSRVRYTLLFFSVSASRWQTCLLEDTLDGERIIEDVGPVKKPQLYFHSLGASKGRFEMRLGAEVVATAQARYLDTLTDGHTRDTAYLTWIGVVEQHRGQGIGAEFLTRLAQFLLSKQYRYLHTDTAGHNVRAQGL